MRSYILVGATTSEGVWQHCALCQTGVVHSGINCSLLWTPADASSTRYLLYAAAAAAAAVAAAVLGEHLPLPRRHAAHNVLTRG
jgi:hypothetical protein